MSGVPAEKPVRGRPFQKGGDPRRNAGGRVPGLSITALLRAELDKPTVQGSAVTRKQMIAEKLLNLAQAGDLGAIREVLDRTEGKSIARNENGEPGSFDLDLEAARKVLKIVPGSEAS